MIAYFFAMLFGGYSIGNGLVYLETGHCAIVNEQMECVVEDVMCDGRYGSIATQDGVTVFEVCDGEIYYYDLF